MKPNILVFLKGILISDIYRQNIQEKTVFTAEKTGDNAREV